MKLRDICKFQSGGTPSKSKAEYFHGNIPWITTVALNGRTINQDAAVDWITEQAIAETAAKIVPTDSVLVGMRVGVGKVAVNSIPISTNQDIVSLTKIDKNRWDTGYLCKFLQSKAPYLKSQARGATIKGIKMDVLEALEVPERPLADQKRIVQKLETTLEIIAARRAQLSALDALVKSRFVEMFGDPQHDSLDWKTRTIGECCALKSGTSLPSAKENEGGPIPYVKVGDMNLPDNARFITTSSRFVSVDTAGRGIFPVGSILFPKRGGAIGTNKKRMTKVPVCADLNIMGVTSKGDLLPEYLLLFFDMLDLGTLLNGSSVPQINNKDIAPLRIDIPPLALQRHFASFVALVERAKASIRASLAKTQTLFDSLMQEYFTN